MTKIDETQRTTIRTVTFARSFNLDGIDESLPAGAYRVETDEELLQGVSFPAYRRTGTTIQRVADSAQFSTETIVISDPRQLDLALAKDQSAAAQDDASAINPATR